MVSRERRGPYSINPVRMDSSLSSFTSPPPLYLHTKLNQEINTNNSGGSRQEAWLLSATKLHLYLL